MCATLVRASPAVPAGPLVQKLGTVDIAACETTPLVVNGSLWRFESLHGNNWGNVDTNVPKRSYFRFVNSVPPSVSLHGSAV